MKTNEIPDSNYLIYTFYDYPKIIEKIGLIIPGYKGYAVRGRSRNTDKITRKF
jgi:hypothetical protein